MVELANIVILTETLLDSNMLGTLLGAYFFLYLLHFVSFMNIYSVDKYEYLNYRVKERIKFKYNLFFIIMYSKQKNIISKKTFISELIGYLIVIASIIVFICSLKQDVTTAFILLAIVALVIFTFGCITGGMYHKIRKYI